MSNPEEPQLNFSQRSGLSQLPPQLKLGEVSDDFRRRIEYALHELIDNGSLNGYGGDFLVSPLVGVFKDFYVKVMGLGITYFDNSSYKWKKHISEITYDYKWHKLFDFIEFFTQRPEVQDQFKQEFSRAFIEARLAYRVAPDGRIIAIGSEEQAQAVVRAIHESEKHGAQGARDHLIEAGVQLRHGHWRASVRESIHAVETVATHYSKENTLGKSLDKLGKRRGRHVALFDAFDKLYGWTNNKGIRHAKVFDGAEDHIDEVDALFMIGACASFVSWLLARFTAPAPEPGNSSVADEGPTTPA